MSALSPTHDQDLSPTLERIRLDDPGGFDEIYNLYIDDVRRSCRRQLGRQDRCEQYEEDLAQEVMLVLWQTLCSFAKSCNRWRNISHELIQAVICRLIFEQGINRGKHNGRQKRQRCVPLPLLYAELTRSRQTGHDQDEIDVQDAFYVAFNCLSRSKTRDLILRKLRGESVEEIASAYQRSPRSIRRILAVSIIHFENFLFR
ncbi:RNA polymerase sigma factor [Pirellulaceae bacterium SH449]